MKNGSVGRTVADQNSEIRVTIEDTTTMSATATTDVEKATTKIGMSVTTPWNTIGEGTTKDTQNGKGTGISAATKEEVIFAGKTVRKQHEITIGYQSQT